jgi:hypothetical protein
VNQVNVTIPATAPTGCNISVVGVTAGGIPTNFLTLPIGNGPCSDPAFGISGSTLSSLSGKTTVNTGIVFLDQSTAPATSGSGTQVSDIALAGFISYTGSTFTTSNTSGSGQVSIGSCVVLQNLNDTGTTGGTVTTVGLDAGNITVTGPSGVATLTSVAQFLPGYYEAQLTSGFIPQSGGSFAITATGGTSASGNVGPFTTSINYPNPVLTWTNQNSAAKILRTGGFTVSWTGGSADTFVVITGSSTSGSTFGSFSCYAPVSAGQFTVPPYVLAALPAGTGDMSVSNYTNYTTFTATGLDLGIAAGFVTYDVNSAYQ